MNWVTDLKLAAVLADDYALTHKKSGFSDKPYPVKSYWSVYNGLKPKTKTKAGNGQNVASIKV